MLEDNPGREQSWCTAEGDVLNRPASLLKNDPDSIAERGRLVAQLLSCAWRCSPQTNSAEELAAIAGLLLKSGAGGLAWCAVRDTKLSASAVGESFHNAYRLHSLQAALQQRSLKKILPLLRNVGVDPVLVKGWAIARLYPEPGMRPYGDLDLCVLPDQYFRALEALETPEAQTCNVDLHLGFGKFYERHTEDVLARSELVGLDDVQVRILSPEDHLRFLCLHLLRHGAAVPLWLCDIAVLLETRADDFDWDRCLSGSRRQADWVACAIGLANRLVGAKIEGTPIARRANELPGWLAPAVLQQWGVPFRFPAQIAVYLRHPVRLLRGLLEELPRHWPNPIEATMTLKGPFNELPRFPFQVGHVFSRTASLLLDMSRGVGRET